MTVEFFSQMDKTDGPGGKGQIASTLPAWYFNRNIESLEQDIQQTKRRLESGHIPHRMEGQVKSQLAKMEKKLAGLKDSRPKMDDKTSAVIGSVYKDLSKTIADVLPSRKQNEQGTVDPGKLADLMSKPVIKVSDQIAEMANANGLRVSRDCKMSLTDASIMFKMTGRLLDAETNVEVLRKDK